MKEQGPGSIELSGLLNQIKSVQGKAQEVRNKLLEHFVFDPSTIGNLIFRTKKRKNVGSDGTIEEVPWTMDGLLEEMEKSRQEGLIETKQYLAMDTLFAIQSQERFFSNREHPLKNDSDNNSAFLLDLLERVLSSKDEIGERYPIGIPTEEYWTAELLEVIRRTVLKPTTLLLEGYGRSGIHSVPGYEDEEFWGRSRLPNLPPILKPN